MAMTLTAVDTHAQMPGRRGDVRKVKRYDRRNDEVTCDQVEWSRVLELCILPIGGVVPISRNLTNKAVLRIAFAAARNPVDLMGVSRLCPQMIEAPTKLYRARFLSWSPTFLSG